MSISRWLVPIVVLPGTALVAVPTLVLWLSRNTSHGAQLADLQSWQFWVGLFCALAGGVFALWSMLAFLRHGEGTPAPWDPPEKLVIRGPYRYVQNPMISGVWLLLAGAALLTTSWPLAAWAALFLLANAIYFPWHEEPGLRARFGDDYIRYSQHVGRWLPRLRPWTPAASNATNARPRPPVWPKLALLAGSLMFVGLLAEIGLRVAGVTYPVTTVRDLHCGYGYVPNATWTHTSEGRSHVSINGCGFRDRQWEVAKPAGVRRIAVLGDSFVAAMEVEANQRFTAILEQELNAGGGSSTPAGDAIEVLNFGRAGYGTAQELMVLRHHVRQFEPDVVILAFFTANDLRNNSRELEGEPLFPYFQLDGGRLELDDSFVNYRQSAMVRAVKNAAQYLRVAQLAYRLKYLRAALRMRGKRRAATGIEAELYALGLTDPDSETRIYASPQDPHWQTAWTLTELLLAQMKEEVEAAGAEFVVVTLSNDIQVHPDREVRRRFQEMLGCEDLFYPDNRIAELAARAGIPHLALAPSLQRQAEETGRYLHGFENTQLGWGHWNAEGHRLAGELIAKWLEEVPR